MVINVNIKSVVIGFLLGVAIVLAMGAAANSSRYQIAVTSSADGSIIFARVDIDTGEVVACRQGVTSIFPKPTQHMPAAGR